MAVDDGVRREVAVKVLRPGIERKFRRDLASYFFAARQIERFHAPSRRLRPVAVVDTLAHSVEIEMDMRLEAAAISEMADNIEGDRLLPDGAFRVPAVDWRRTAKRVLTLEWIDGIPISDHAALRAAGHDLRALGLTVLRSFLRHAMRDGFFHADMHQGNLLVDRQGTVVAVDFGIMGRLGLKERRFLAEILHGLITRDYRRTAAIHFEAGYVPATPVGRAVRPGHARHRRADPRAHGGRDLHGRPAGPAVRLHRGVRYGRRGRSCCCCRRPWWWWRAWRAALDPELNIWIGRGADRQGMDRGQLRRGRAAAGGWRGRRDGCGKVLAEVPRLLEQAERTALALAEMARGGLRLDDDTIERLAAAQAREGRWSRWALWVGALALAAIALWLIAPVG